MKELYLKLNSKVDGLDPNQACEVIKSESSSWCGIRDEFDRSLLHYAVELGKLKLVNSLLRCGAFVNGPEACGATPLTLAVISCNIDMVKLLLLYKAKIDGLSSTNVPPPIEVALKMGDQSREVTEILAKEMKSLKEQITSVIRDVLPVLMKSKNPECLERRSENRNHKKSSKEIVLTAGDAKTTSNIRSAWNRAPDQFGAFQEIQGDFHPIGYVMVVWHVYMEDQRFIICARTF